MVYRGEYYWQSCREKISDVCAHACQIVTPRKKKKKISAKSKSLSQQPNDGRVHERTATAHIQFSICFISIFFSFGQQMVPNAPESDPFFFYEQDNAPVWPHCSDATSRPRHAGPPISSFVLSLALTRQSPKTEKRRICAMFSREGQSGSITWFPNR